MTIDAKIENITRDFVLTNDQLEKVKYQLLSEFKNGLSKENYTNSVLKMLPTYVRDVPNGRERGEFLALDLGGTNFRVLYIQLGEGGHFKMSNRVFPIPKERMLGTGDELFDHIAECVVQFMHEYNLTDKHLPLGFTFSFPCKQESLTKATLVSWTKGFHCTDACGRDVVEMLKSALDRRDDVKIDIIAILNDTTGTLMSCAYQNNECRIGVIVGTGTNACYMEQLCNVERWNDDIDHPSQVIVNCEWGAFGDNGKLDFIRTRYDEDLDDASLNPGKQLFEKMISGMYMGEIVRRILVECTEQQVIFSGKLNDKLTTRNIIDASFISAVEKDSFDEVKSTRHILRDVGILDATDEDCYAVKLICARVSTRAAHLVSAAIATILNKIQRKHTTVGVDGSVYRYHPHFCNIMKSKITELTSPEYSFDLMLSQDGSGVGAALVAAVAVRQQEESIKSSNGYQ